MKAGDPLINEPYKEYVRLLRGLHQLLVEGKGDSPEADELRDRMDIPWETLSPEQRDSVGGLAADLNWIRRGPIPGKTSKDELFREDAPAVLRAREDGNWHDVLRSLRRLAWYYPPADLAHLRGEAWSQLGDDATALLFFEKARDLAPEDGNAGGVRVANP
jgi:hypothetical protein